jgi:hypothetical protein
MRYQVRDGLFATSEIRDELSEVKMESAVRTRDGPQGGEHLAAYIGFVIQRYPHKAWLESDDIAKRPPFPARLHAISKLLPTRHRHRIDDR